MFKKKILKRTKSLAIATLMGLSLGVVLPVTVALNNPQTVYAQDPAPVLDPLPLTTTSSSSSESSSSSKTSTASGDYSSLNLPAVLSTAYADTKNEIQKLEAEANSTYNTETGDDVNDKISGAYDRLYVRLGVLMNAGNYGNAGLFIGQNNSTNQPLMSNFTNNIALSDTDIKKIDAVLAAKTGTTEPKIRQYQQFGAGITSLAKKARKTKVSNITIEKALGDFSAIALKFSNLGLKLLKKYNPAPLILSFWNLNELSNYAPGDNAWVDIINGNASVKSIFSFFGGQSPIPGVTTSFMIFGVLSVLAFLFGAFTSIWNGQKFMITIRKILLRTAIAGAGLYAASLLMTRGLNYLVEFVDNSATAGTTGIVQKNLLLADWYESGFKLPEGTTVTVENGKLQMSQEAIGEINRWLYKRKFGEVADDETLAKYIKEKASVNNNTYQIAFMPPVTSSGSTWRTAAVMDYSKYITEAVDEKNSSDEDIVTKANNAGYFAYQSNSASGDGSGTITYTGANDRTYGISPIAAYNLMGTDFSNNSIKYNNNLGAPTIPTVAINIVYGSTLGEDGRYTSNPILKFVISVVMVIAAVKALIDIFVAGFGGIFKGGAKSAFGSAEGIGEVVGGVLALLLGVAGMGLIMTLSITFVDVIWGIIMDLLGKQSANDAFGGFVEDLDLGIFDFMKGILTWGLDSFMAIAGFFMMPKFVKVPIQAFGQFCASIPGSMAARAARWGVRFTGDHHTGAGGVGGGGGLFGGGGSRGGGLANNVGQAAQAGLSDAAKATGAGAALGGAVLGGILSKAGDLVLGGKSSENSAGDINKNDSESLNEGDEDSQNTTEGNENVDQTAEETVDARQAGDDGDVTDSQQVEGATISDQEQVTEGSLTDSESVVDGDITDAESLAEGDNSLSEQQEVANQTSETSEQSLSEGSLNEGDSQSLKTGDTKSSTTENGGNEVTSAEQKATLNASDESNGLTQSQSSSGPVTNSQGGTNEQTTDASKSSENANVKEQVNASVNGGNVESRETTDISGGESLSRDTINGAPETSVDGDSPLVEGNNNVKEAITDVNGTAIGGSTTTTGGTTQGGDNVNSQSENRSTVTNGGNSSAVTNKASFTRRGLGNSLKWAGKAATGANTAAAGGRVSIGQAAAGLVSATVGSSVRSMESAATGVERTAPANKSTVTKAPATKTVNNRRQNAKNGKNGNVGKSGGTSKTQKAAATAKSSVQQRAATIVNGKQQTPQKQSGGQTQPRKQQTNKQRKQQQKKPQATQASKSIGKKPLNNQPERGLKRHSIKE